MCYQFYQYNREQSIVKVVTRHVSQNNSNPDWQQCYNSMLQATSVLKLSLDPVDMFTERSLLQRFV